MKSIVTRRHETRPFSWLRTAAVAAAACIGFVAVFLPASAADRPNRPMPEATPELIEQGTTIYFRRCSFCHGLLGDGEGPAAKYLDPRPRDFTLGTFKFRTTQSGELPTDEDLFRTVSRGLPGTAMQAFDDDTIKNGLSEAERWAVIAYIKTFAPEFDNPELDPVATGKVISLPANRPEFSPELVAKGKEIFLRAKCWECHGKLGRGDGQKSFDREDDWGFPIRIRNVTLDWKIKGGIDVEDIYMRFSTGINGSPMPSFAKALDEDERWQLANFIKSLQHQATTHQVLQALRLEGALPDTADDDLWAQAEPMDVRLAGQVISAPRWQNPSIEQVTMRAVFNDTEIAFQLSWDDPFKDITHAADQEFDAIEISKLGAFNSYVEAIDMIPRKLETYRDAVALLFPVKQPEGTKKPHFHRGESSLPLHMWRWNADLDAKGQRAVEEAVSRGWKVPPKAQPEDQQQSTSKAVWEQGRWRLVVKRPLDTGDKNDVQFKSGTFIPMAVNAWDGSNGEHGLIMSLSSWHYVLLKEATPFKVYLYTALAFLLIAGFGIWLMRKVEKNESGNAGG